MKVLVACESSGIVREAFRRRGHDAWSCDLLPAEDGSPYHLQCDVLNVLHRGWDLMIAHPSCTFLTGSAAWAFKDPDFKRYPGSGYHQKLSPSTLTGAARREAREKAIRFTHTLWSAPIPCKVIENPRGFLSSMWRKPSQVIQPYQFGNDASKATCLWIDGPGTNLLQPTKFIPPRLVCCHCKEVWKYPVHKCFNCFSPHLLPRWANQTDSGQNILSPGADRWKDRSRTFPGIAEALATQLITP